MLVEVFIPNLDMLVEVFMPNAEMIKTKKAGRNWQVFQIEDPGVCFFSDF
jgi:hypothetical protein